MRHAGRRFFYILSPFAFFLLPTSFTFFNRPSHMELSGPTIPVLHCRRLGIPTLLVASGYSAQNMSTPHVILRVGAMPGN